MIADALTRLVSKSSATMALAVYAKLALSFPINDYNYKEHLSVEEMLMYYYVSFQQFAT